MLDLSVVIVSFNTRELLLQCLRSVASGVAIDAAVVAEAHDVRHEGGANPVSREHRPIDVAPFSVEIWVVDNASTDGTVQAIRDSFPTVKLITNEQNRGFAAACNQALNWCNGRHILLLNPDTILLEDALRQLVEFLDAHPHVGIVGGQLVYPDGSFQHSAFRFPTLPMSFLDFFPINHRLVNSRLNGRYPLSAYDRPFPIDHPLGAALLVRKEVLDQIGLLDEGFFMYCEEIDLCIRTKQKGWEIYCVPSARIVHYSAQSTKQFRAPMFVELYRSRYRLFRKHYSGVYNQMARIIIRFAVLWEIARRWLKARRKEITSKESDEMLSAYWAVFRM